MIKDIKNYLHLYLGCEVEVTDESESWTKTLTGFETRDNGSYTAWCNITGYNSHNGYSVKPILRPLSDMTEEEKEELEEYQYDDNVVTLEKYGTVIQSYVPIIFERMLEMQFDLFGLIEAGIAIDKTKK